MEKQQALQLGACFVDLDIQHATSVRYIAICGLSRSTIFFRLISQEEDCRKKKVIEYKMCVFLQHFFETFLILRRTERDAIKMNIILLVKYPLFSSDFTETSILSTDFRKTLKYQIS